MILGGYPKAEGLFPKGPRKIRQAGKRGAFALVSGLRSAVCTSFAGYANKGRGGAAVAFDPSRI